MPPIRIEGLTKNYKDGPRAVDHVDLEIHDGEFMVLVGPSGCGKSTLLQMLAGIIDVTEGTIHIGDEDVTRLDPRKRDIAMVFQSYALYPHLSVRGNLGFGLKLRGTDKAEIARRVHDVARILGLDEVLDRKPGELSGGQRQRVLVARALVQDARLLLLDEPFTGLDGPSAERLGVLLDRLAGEGRAVLVSTHDLRQALQWDLVLCLNHRQVAFGPPRETLTREVVEATYGGEIVEVPGDGAARGLLPAHHHDHAH
jgi:multiple sugar transport system ATP-binding protein